MKLLLGMPTSTSVDAQFALENLPAIISYTKKHLPSLELKTLFKTGVRTDSNRNWILNEALNQGIDYILWLDTDEIYPVNIVEKLLTAGKDIIGTCYYKRSEPYSPVVYIDNDNPQTKEILPYTPIDLPFIPKGQLLEISGLGFGGLLVRTDVYRLMGDDKWMTYGKNFHIPLELPDKESHDLIFCKTAKQYGYKLYVHTSVRAAHISRQLITEKQFMDNLTDIKMPKIVVLMPSINKEKAQATVNQLSNTAGMKAEYVVLEDKNRDGYVAMANKGYSLYKDADYIVYLAEDAYGGKDWLKIAFETIQENNAGLLAFNDGKWNGRMASFGMIKTNWLRFLYGDTVLMCPEYKSHYADTELSVIAQSQGKMIYNPSAVLMEIDADKKNHVVNEDDRKKFIERKQTGFDGIVLDPKYLNLFEASTNEPLKQGIIIVAHESTRKFFENLMKTLEGCKYPIYIVINESKKYPYFTEKIKKKYKNVIEFESDNFEASAFEANKKLKLDEFVLLQSTIEILDQSLFDMVFENLKGKSVAFTSYPVLFGCFMGKYRKIILDQTDYILPTTKKEAVEMETDFNQQYIMLDQNTVLLWRDFIDTDVFEEKFGEKRMVIENKFIRKYKGTWSRNMIKS